MSLIEAHAWGQDFKLNVLSGKLNNHFTFNVASRITDVNSQSIDQDIWTGAGIDVIQPSVAGPVTLVSDSSEDNPFGNGVHQIQILALDANYSPIRFLMTPNGTTPVTSVTKVLRIIAAYVTFCGALGRNAGNISFSVGGNEISHMMANKGRTQNSHFTVPAGYVGVISSISASSDNENRGVYYHLYTRDFNRGRKVVHNNTVYRGGVYSDTAIYVNEKADIFARANLANGGTTGIISMSCNYVINLIKSTNADYLALFKKV